VWRTLTIEFQKLVKAENLGFAVYRFNGDSGFEAFLKLFRRAGFLYG